MMGTHTNLPTMYKLQKPSRSHDGWGSANLMDEQDCFSLCVKWISSIQICWNSCLLLIFSNNSPEYWRIPGQHKHLRILICGLTFLPQATKRSFPFLKRWGNPCQPRCRRNNHAAEFNDPGFRVLLNMVKTPADNAVLCYLKQVIYRRVMITKGLLLAAERL